VSADRLVVELVRAQVRVAASLPDQWLTGVLGALDDESSIRHIRLTREDEGVGICIGAGLAGVRAVVVCQNAGVLLSMNALSGAAHHHRAPVVVIAVQRGQGADPYPYQAYKGLVTRPVLEAAGIQTLEARAADDFTVIEEAFVRAEAGRTPVVILAQRSAVAPPTDGAA
jgi:sulfopyruvate decarboxylase subunit alpha